VTTAAGASRSGSGHLAAQLSAPVRRLLRTGVAGAGLLVAATAAGLVLPALIYLAVDAGVAGAAGWGIPMATDTAFRSVVVAEPGAVLTLSSWPRTAGCSSRRPPTS
jgi:hypothetical protein